MIAIARPNPYARIIASVQGRLPRGLSEEELAIIDCVRRIARQRPRRKVANTPLLRGTITSVTGWWDSELYPGWEHLSGQLSVWCPHCATWHLHGWHLWDTGGIATHRVAHCAGGPFRQTGYWVSVWRKTDPGYAGHAERPGTIIFRRKRPVPGGQTT